VYHIDSFAEKAPVAFGVTPDTPDAPEIINELVFMISVGLSCVPTDTPVEMEPAVAVNPAGFQ
jgi:hypothetical protein